MSIQRSISLSVISTLRCSLELEISHFVQAHDPAQCVGGGQCQAVVYDLTLARGGQLYTVPTGTTFGVDIPLYHIALCTMPARDFKGHSGEYAVSHCQELAHLGHDTVLVQTRYSFLTMSLEFRLIWGIPPYVGVWKAKNDRKTTTCGFCLNSNMSTNSRNSGS
jgi:hypothetical protein